MPVTNAARVCVVADIGGTNTRVALASGAEVLQASIRRFPNADFAGLEPILQAFLAETGTTACAGACVAVAGPVRDGVAEMTNLDWTMTDASIAGATGATHVALLNDLQAQGHALGHLRPESLIPVVEGPDAGPRATKLVIGVGTGFNAAPVHETPRGRLVAPSECGHVSLPVRGEADQRLARFVEALPEVHGFAAVEDVLSGRGLERVMAWAAAGSGATDERSAAEIMAAIDLGQDPVALETGRAFAAMLGTVAGNLALTHLPFGGVFLIGGVARAFARHLVPLGFAQAFRDKGRFADFMQDFPVWVIVDDYAALSGCAVHLAQLMPDHPADAA